MKTSFNKSIVVNSYDMNDRFDQVILRVQLASAMRVLCFIHLAGGRISILGTIGLGERLQSVSWEQRCDQDLHELFNKAVMSLGVSE